MTFSGLRNASRELHVACDRTGKIRYADDRARRILGVTADHSLRDVVTPGCDAKLDDLLSRASSAPVADWELPFVVNGAPVTLVLDAAPGAEETVLLVGHLIPQTFVHAMAQVNEMMTEVVDLNRELREEKKQLVESNRGILALHAELQEAEAQTRHDADVKQRMVSNLSHELRTPLHSILGLTQLLDNKTDGPLSGEQSKQVSFIQQSARELLGLVDDVLDLGTLASGNARLRIEAFDVADLFASLRGALRPLLPATSPVDLIIDEPPPLKVETDQNKLAQIVRNLVSNAMKFTAKGTIHVSCAIKNDRLRISVLDTGVGISPEDHGRVFEEYGQIDNPMQKHVKGTGLGLPLSRRLAGFLGGTLTLESEPGKGSTFLVDIPIRHDEARAMTEMVERSREKAAGSTSILVVEDDRKTLFLYEKYLVMAGFHVLPARSIEDAETLMATTRPAAIVLDVMLEGDASWGFLARVKSNPATSDIPVLVVTVTNRADKARALGADEFWLKPVDQDRLLRKLRELAAPQTATTNVLVIDDDEKARYIIKRHLIGTPYTLLEASNGKDGVTIARREHPKVILLDFLLQGETAFDVLDELKADPQTRGIPVIIVTSHVLDAVDQKRLLEEAEAVISKQNLSRELAINRIRDALHKLDGLEAK
ncbi:MAG TPA: response regulator [Kofleriaceae bacterium]